MLITVIIKFELRGPGPPGCAYTPRTVYFYDKTKISKENFQENYYLLLNIARGNKPCFPYMGQITYKI